MNDSATINPHDLARLQLQERLAERAGFSMRAPLYALGTPVIDLGRENYKRSRASFEALPSAHDVFRGFVSRIAEEARHDIEARVNSLRLDPMTGRVYRDPAKPIYLDGPATMRGILARTECPEPGAAAAYLATIPLERRAAEFNAWTASAKPDAIAVLRTRLALAPTGADTMSAGALAPYAREVYGVVSERYGRGMEVDALTSHLSDAILRGLFPGDARGEVTYDGRRAVIRALWHSNIAPERVCAGEVFKAGVTVTASDDGSLSINVDGTLWRNLCLNLIVIDEARKNAGSRRHMGNRDDLRAWLFDALQTASRSVADFADLWDRARAIPLLDAVRDVPATLVARLDDGDTSAERDLAAGVFRGMLKRDLVTIPGARGEAGVAALLKSYDREPESSRAGIVNAVTRAAHEHATTNVWSADDLQSAGGAILKSARPFDFVDKGAAAF